MANAKQEVGFDIAIKEVPITEHRLPFVQKEGNHKLKDRGIARANKAASIQAPNGTTKNDYAHRNKDKTVLQQHIAFFDVDSDGIIWPQDTWIGFRRLGYSLPFTLLSTLIIHINFSYLTLPTFLPDPFLPDPFFRIHTARIHKDKHGSDSGTYDPEGRFIPQKFEDIFSKYASGDKEGIYWNEIWNYMHGQRVVMDLFGWSAAIFEWMATYLLLWPEDGRMMKDDIRRIYDGSLFYEIAARRAKREQ